MSNFDNIDVTSTFGLSPPSAGDVPELLRFSRNLDAANAQINVKYHKAKEVISTNILDQASNDEFVETVAEVVLDRVGEQIRADVRADISTAVSAAMVPLITAINTMSSRLGQVENAVGQLSGRVDALGARVDELRDDFRNADIERKINSTQNSNIMNRSMLGKVAEPVCFYTGENPVELGLPPLRTAADVDSLSLRDIDRYCEGYRLPGLVWNHGATTGCKMQKENIRDFVRVVSLNDMQKKMRNNRTD